MTPRDTDPLTVEERQPLRPNPTELEPADPVSILIGLLLVALSAALVAGLLGFAVGRASAAPRSAAPVIEAWHPLEAPLLRPLRALVQPAPADGLTAPPPRSGSAMASAPVLTVPEDVEPTTSNIGTAVVSGTATWYDDGSGLYAAVPSYRWGDPRYKVEVCNRAGACVTVTVRDFCGCPGDRVIDLSPAAFRKLAPLSRGIVAVTVEELRAPTVTPPATDVP